MRGEDFSNGFLFPNAKPIKTQKSKHQNNCRHEYTSALVSMLTVQYFSLRNQQLCCPLIMSVTRQALAPPSGQPGLSQFYYSPHFLGQYSDLSLAEENNWESAFSFGCQGCQGNILESELNLDNIITNIILSNGINILSGFYGYNTPTSPTV